ncbi:TasA family protein [[Bacillus] enclensis]|uniref:TasA family protein n=1 Tax=[Bacillus] enclensis TaxID=1402860 RepID=UPI0018DD7A0B|nr:TasA family protein [[Bacillus] enclensis]MBH9966660.1 LPXTG cell wall anchor domain-containing protein [[Bacillus] enclensis]
MNNIRFSISILIIIMILFAPGTLQAEENNNEQKDIDISVSPSPVLFNLTNVKPGDSMTRKITVKNKGNQDFQYLFTNNFLSGSEKFYNELLLVISKGKESLVEGKIKDFKKMDLRTLESSSSETFEITVEIPYELGNEFQGLSTEFKFNFLVEGPDGAILPVGGGRILPDTGTDYYMYLVLGSVLFIAGISLYMITRREFASKELEPTEFQLKERKEV